MVTTNASNEPTAASGKVLQGQGVGTASNFSTATYPSTAGTSGKVLVSDGTNIVSSTPTFPNASATSGKLIQSDGTNWIASTPTFPTTAGTSGKILISDGTNIISSTPTYPNSASGTGTILRADGTNWVATTSTYPNTNAVSTLLYASSSNVMAALATANNGTLVTSNTGVPSILAGPGTTGNILQSNAAAAPSFSTATYPATTGANTMMISTSANAVTTTTFIAATSYTPALAFGGGSTGITYGTRLGRYTQIGNMVTFSADITLTNKGSSTGNATISLPVTAAAGVPTVELFLFLGAITTTGTYNSLDITASGTTGLVVQVVASTGAATALTDAAFGNTTVLRVTGSYWV